ncbi:MAG: biopolymer transporter ExbD [Akkermansiaceae bacterium]|nr:biopolymer transporter ExbD [Akkermansiaceae bacterium]
MSRRSKRKQSGEVNLGFQIAPMIDVVFVIMLYFMVMAGAVQVENAHNTKLPGTVATETDTPMPDEIAVRIEDDGQVYLNDDPLDTPEAKQLPEFANNLMQLHESSKASKSEVLVTIYANELARYERVIDVLDALSRAEISNVTFQAGSPE